MVYGAAGEDGECSDSGEGVEGERGEELGSGGVGPGEDEEVGCGMELAGVEALSLIHI